MLSCTYVHTHLCVCAKCNNTAALCILVSYNYLTVHCSLHLQSMGQLVRKVLDECERLKARSVAIPPLGAGTLKFPNSHDIIVGSINTFLSSGACHSLKKIVLVVDCADLHDTFRKSLETLM